MGRLDRLVHFELAIPRPEIVRAVVLLVALAAAARSHPLRAELSFTPVSVVASPVGSDKYGFSVGLGGGITAVGAPFHFGANQAIGRVYVAGAVLSPTPIANNTGFGTDVATDGTLLVAGKWRPWNGESGGTYEVFQRNAGGWSRIGTVGGGPRVRFDDDGTFTVGGAIYDFGLVSLGSSGGLHAEKEGARSVGCSTNAEVYERDDSGVWQLVRTFVPGAMPAPLGSCVDLAHSDGRVAIAVPAASSVFVHHRDAGGTNNWGLVATIATQATPNVKVDMEGGRLVVAEYDAAARLFHRDLGGPDNWGYVGYFPAPPGARFAWDIDMDGDTFVGSREYGPCCGATSGTVVTFNLNASDLRADVAAPATAIAGTAFQYSLTVRNDGPSTAYGVTIALEVPAQLLGVVIQGCPSGALTGQICLIGDMPAGSTRELTIGGTINPFFRGQMTGGAVSAMASPDTNTGNEAGSFITDVAGQADGSVTKTDNRVSATPGLSTTYLIRVTNSGPSGSSAVQLLDQFNAPLSNCTWTAASSGGATGMSSGAGPQLSAALRMPPLSTVTYTVDCGIPAAATGQISNFVTIGTDSEDPDSIDRSATDSTDLISVADLSIAKTDNMSVVAFGSTIEYEINVFSSGPSIPVDVVVVDALPIELSNITWTCVAAAGSSCPPSGGPSTIIPIALGVQSGVIVRLTGEVTVPDDRLIENSVSVSSIGGTFDPQNVNNVATDSTTILMPDLVFRDGFEISP